MSTGHWQDDAQLKLQEELTQTNPPSTANGDAATHPAQPTVAPSPPGGADAHVSSPHSQVSIRTHPPSCKGTSAFHQSLFAGGARWGYNLFAGSSSGTPELPIQRQCDLRAHSKPAGSSMLVLSFLGVAVVLYSYDGGTWGLPAEAGAPSAREHGLPRTASHLPERREAASASG